MKISTFILQTTKLTITLCLFNLGCFCLNSNQFVVLAQTEQYNPLESIEPDPLLPSPEIDRPLTSLEKRLIKETNIVLNNQARSELATGNKDKAFALWYRELRLQRVLGRTEEITALGRVGEIAWQQNLSQELNIISDRLLAIQQEITTEDAPINIHVLKSLGQAYQQVRDLDRAVIIYQQILEKNRQEDNFSEEQKNLETLGELHLAQFDYIQAANIYEELLKSVQNDHSQTSLNGNEYTYTSQTDTNSLQKENYLNQLVGIYDRLSQPDKSIEIKQKLLTKYLDEQKTEQLAALKISLAKDYQNLKQPKKAQTYYEEAFSLAWSLQQLAIAEESLEKLALLYQDYQQPNAALEIYQELIKVHQKAYSYYNLMNTYSQIGQIYEQLNNDRQALNAYKKGLELAQSLNYRVEYFQGKIGQLQKK
ncbi:MAG: tetratricopeptide repeat protein [Xenococcaceae cyanobacterium MO_188.B29]|nr:tetratricopeptide repeat protein [Xenococcaceae cyanobacterium MO_188.B29]